MVLLPFISVYAQKNHSFFLNTGYTYNNSIELNEQIVKNSKGLLFTVGGVKKLITYKENYLELGFGLKTIFSSGRIGGLKFNASTCLLYTSPSPRD